MNVFEYQNAAISSIIDLIKKEKTVLTFQAPTGSGKTFIMANLIQRLVELPKFINQNLTFIYISPSIGEIDFQAYKKITSYVNDNFIHGVKTEYLGRMNNKSCTIINDHFIKNTVYFIGWDMLKATSKIVQENEKYNIYDIIQETHFYNNKIVLIVDEAHREYGVNLAETKKRFVFQLKPTIEIKMTATPTEIADVWIDPIDVKLSGMIKQEIVVNPINAGYQDKDKIMDIIKRGLQQRKNILNSIKKTKYKVNPLMLIQIPDKSPIVGKNGERLDDFYIKYIEAALCEEGMREGYNYAYWLNKNKTKGISKDSISLNNSPIDVLVFKQAIATGWDVPRSCVLVKLRNPKSGSKSFEVQTLGRINRNPFLKVFVKNYRLTSNDVKNLNYSFVFTNEIDWKPLSIWNGNSLKLSNEYKLTKKARENPDLIFSIILSNITKKSILNVNFRTEIINDILANRKFTNNLMHKISNQDSRELKIMKTQGIDTAPLSEGRLKTNLLNKGQLSWQVNSPNYNLYYIYIEFLNRINRNQFLIDFLDKFSKIYNVKKKLIYKYFIENYSASYKSDRTLFFEFQKLLFKSINNHLSYVRSNLFSLENKISYLNEFTSLNENTVNAYNLKFKRDSLSNIPFDSNIEYEFYKLIDKCYESHKNIGFYIFRNKTNPLNSYFIEYLNLNSMRPSYFYPDFILNTKRKIIIVECKGIGKQDVDPMTIIKFDTLRRNLTKIHSNKEIYLFKVGIEDQNLVFIRYKEDSNQPSPVRKEIFIDLIIDK